MGKELFDGLIPDNLGGDMAAFDSYKALEVDTIKQTLQTASVALIKGVYDIYLKTDQIDADNYLKGIQEMEVMTLGSLLAQVKYANHAIDTLMRYLDAGGYTQGLDIYETIVKLQNNAVSITMQVSRYVRTLPEYFRSVKDDMLTANTQFIVLNNNKNEQESEDTEPQQDDQLSGPIRDTRKMLMQLQKMHEQVSEIRSIETQSDTDAEIVQDKPSSIDIVDKETGEMTIIEDDAVS